MFAKFKNYLKYKLVFRKSQILYFVFFFILSSISYISISSTPNQNLNFVSDQMTLISKENSTNSFSFYYKQKQGIKIDNDVVSKSIRDFNNFNGATSNEDYRELVCSNLNKKTVHVNELQDKTPTVIMTAWSSFYYDIKQDKNIFMSDIAVEGLKSSSVTDYYFCFITDEQADYLISNSNGKYETYNDLIDEKLNFGISYSGKYESFDFSIRDIIKSDYGASKRYDELFGSYVICYYIPFLRTSGFEFFYDLSDDGMKNFEIIKGLKEPYNLDDFDFEIFSNIETKRKNEIKEQLFNAQSEKDFSLFLILILLIPMVIFIFMVFDECEKKPDLSLSFSLIFGIEFTLIYLLIFTMSKLKVLFFLKMFNSTAVLINLLFLILIFGSIIISYFVKETPNKFARKYVNEKHIH